MEHKIGTETVAHGTLTTQTHVEGTTMLISLQPRCAASAVAEVVEAAVAEAALPNLTKRNALTLTETVETVEATIALGTMIIKALAEVSTIQISSQMLIAALVVAESTKMASTLQTEVIAAGAQTPPTELEIQGMTPVNGMPPTIPHVDNTMMMISIQIPCVATVMAEVLEVTDKPETMKAP